MRVYASEYSREDGRVMAFRTQAGLWCLRCVRGPTYFWNFEKKSWTSITSLSENESVFREPYAAPFDAALELLVTIKPVE